MSALPQTTVTTDFTVTAREIDFVTRFNRNWDALREILGIMRPIRKAVGTKLVTYTTSNKGGIKGGSTVAEGDIIPFTEYEVIEAEKEDVVVEKYAKAVTIECVEKYGPEIAVEKTDDEFLVDLQNQTMTTFYNFLKTGTLIGTQKTWQRALAIAKGAVLNEFKKMHKTVTEVVGFASINDYYNWLGDQQITVQTLNGIQYIKDFMGYSTLFLLSDVEIADGTVIATPVDNINLYYIDPADSGFAKLGLRYTVSGETNLIGFHAEGNYSRAQGESYALMGIKLWAEFINGICVITVGSTNTKPAVQSSP